MKKYILSLLILISGLSYGQVVIPKSTTTFSNISATGNLTVNGTSLLKGPVTTNSTLTLGGKLIQGSLTYTDVNIWSSFQGSSNNYYQSIWQNSSNGNQASTDLIVNNNLGTANNYYGDFGMNSSTYTGSAVFSQPNTVYLYAQDGDLAVGTSSNTSFYIGTNNAYRLKLDSNGRIGLGSAGYSNVSFRNSQMPTGNVNYVGFYNDPVIKSDVTTGYTSYQSIPTLTNTAFTLGSLYHFNASGPTISTQTLTNQYGFYVGTGLTGATNNYAFYSGTAAAANRWNLYMTGTAQNYLAGAVGIGTTTPSYSLHVSGNARITNTTNILGNMTLNSNATATTTMPATSGTVANLSDAVYTMFLPVGLSSPAASSTFYFSNTGYQLSGSASTNSLTIPYNCTLVGWDWNAVTSGVIGSAQTATLSISGTTNYTLSTALSYTAAYTSISATGLSQAFNAGDKYTAKLVTPAWSPNVPTAIYQGLTLYFVRRQ